MELYQYVIGKKRGGVKVGGFIRDMTGDSISIEQTPGITQAGGKIYTFNRKDIYPQEIDGKIVMKEEYLLRYRGCG